jgi:hypothetical protein
LLSYVDHHEGVVYQITLPKHYFSLKYRFE